MPSNAAPDVDHRLRLPHGDVRITHDGDPDNWLASWYPDKDVEGYPGYTRSSLSGECPTGSTLDEMIAWVNEQPWAQPPTA